jgi:chlorophyllide a reductase subunit Y
MAGPVPAPRQARSDKPTITLLGEMFPADPMLIAQMIAPMGLAVGTTAPTREWRELYAALDGSAVAAIHPFYTASIREFQLAGRPIVGSAPVGVDGTHDWLGAIGDATGVSQTLIDTARNATLGAIRGVLSQQKIRGRITLSGYEGSELLVGRLLVECGADLRYVGSACPATPWNTQDADWLRCKGVQVQFRASLEDDLNALHEYQPQLAIGTTPVVQAAKEARVPALYYTNLISARPLMGVAGAGSLIQVINAAMGNQHRFDAMHAFFGEVGQGDQAGVWADVPKPFPNFRKEMRRLNEKAAKKREAQDVGA